jgi:hypothetical protein
MTGLLSLSQFCERAKKNVTAEEGYEEKRIQEITKKTIKEERGQSGEL